VPFTPSLLARTGASLAHHTTQHLPLDQWRIRVNDRNPAYIEWETFVRIQAMLQDNHAEHDRNKTRGIPRPVVS